MTLTDQVAKNIVEKLIKGEDYRIEIVTLINAEFLQYSIDFFKRVAEAKFKNQNITTDWYKKELLNSGLKPEEIAIHSGLNKKTITNMYNSGTKEVVIKASNLHYETLYNAIEELTQIDDLDLNLNIKFGKVSIELNINETLIVVNTLAVKRAALRGGLWSTAGKKTEKPLMLVLCKLFNVKEENYAIKLKGKKSKKNDIEREIDFYLINNGQNYKCEVKLMGKGNPESADAVIARDSAVFVADKLSDLNKSQLDSLNVSWVEMRAEKGYQRFTQVLDKLQIPYQKLENKDLENKLAKVLKDIF